MFFPTKTSYLFFHLINKYITKISDVKNQTKIEKHIPECLRDNKNKETQINKKKI